MRAEGERVAPDPQCPSCNGSGWATIRAGNITVAGGTCRCVGGLNWAAPQPPLARDPEWPQQDC